MKTVTAYQDNDGRLHKTKRGAVDADFISAMVLVWGKLPVCADRGDPISIARMLVNPTYSARKALLEALLEFEMNLKDS